MTVWCTHCCPAGAALATSPKPPTNLALGQNAYSSSALNNPFCYGGVCSAGYAVDGDTKSPPQILHTDGTERDTWLSIDLGASAFVTEIVIYHRCVRRGSVPKHLWPSPVPAPCARSTLFAAWPGTALTPPGPPPPFPASSPLQDGLLRGAHTQRRGPRGRHPHHDRT
jgi:hypothetical protein